MMRERGIDNPDELLAFASPERIIAACEWWDTKRGAGAGVLAAAIRKGGMDPQQASSRPLDREREYGESIVQWLKANFPALDRPVHGPHPAAIAAVIRLHYKHGKGNLTVGEHGAEIREAVRAFKQRWET